MKKHFLMAAIGGMLVLSCMSTFAQEPRKGQGMRHRAAIPACSSLENLDLSAEQREALKRIDDRFRNRIFQLKDKLMLKRIELRDLFTNPDAAQDAIQAKAGEMGEVRDALQQEMIGYQIQIRDILTPDQIRRWCTMMGEPFSQGGWKGGSWHR